MALLPGSKLGPYEITSLLGAGGMGEVYRAHDPRLQRAVAIKVLLSSSSAEPDRRRFEQEARVVGALSHPNLLSVFDVGQHEGKTYIVFELLEGTTLRERLRSGPLPVKKGLEFALQIAQGLAAAHDEGIVHRDLKPDNIFVASKDGRVKILDFGLAKLRPQLEEGEDGTDAATASAITEAGTILGTVAYMSPEQVQARSVDHRSDIFSFGSVLYEMLAGVQPFRRSSAVETMNAILKDHPPDLSPTASVPLALERILGRCLEKNPDDRFRSAHDLAFALDSVAGLSTAGPRSLGSGAVDPASSWSQGHRWLIVAAGLAVALGGVVLGLRLRAHGDRPASHRDASAPIQVESLTSRGDAGDPALSPDGRYLTYLSSEKTGQTIWLRDISEKTETRLVVGIEAEYGNIWGQWFSKDGHALYYSFNPKGSDEARLYRVPLIGGDPQLVRAGGGELSPDERHLAVARVTGGKQVLLVANLESGQEKEIAELGPKGGFDWSPSGAQLLLRRVTDGRHALSIINLDGTAERKIADLPQALAGVWWKPGGGLICGLKESDRDQRLYDLDLGSGRTNPIGDRLWRRIHALHWLPDASGFVLDEAGGKEHSGLWRVSFPGGNAERLLADSHGYWGSQMTPDGTKIAAVQTITRSDILVSPEPEKGVFKKVVSGTDVSYRMCWTPDRRIVYSSNEGGSYDLYVSDATGSSRKQLTFDRARDETEPAASPDGRYIVFSSGRDGERTLCRINVDGTGLRNLTSTTSQDNSNRDPRVTPDSQWVFYRNFDNGPTLWKVPIDGGTPGLVKGTRSQAGEEKALGASISPNGQSLAFLYITVDHKIGWSAWNVVVSSIDGRIGRRFPYLDSKTMAFGDNWRVQWSRDGNALYYNLANDLWRQPVAGGSAARVTHFDDELRYFDWSLDGKALAVSRSSTLSDIVLITNFH